MARIVTVAVMAAAACVAVGGSRSATTAAPRQNGLIVFASDRGADRGGEIYTMRVSSGPVRDVSRSRFPDTEPVVAPGGGRVAFFSRRTGFWALYVGRVDGTGLRRVSRSLGALGYPPAQSIAWAPDGKAIACHADAAPCVARRGVSVTLVPTGGDPSWSADGRLIAYASYARFPPEVTVIRRSGEELWRRPGSSPRWASRGARLAFLVPEGATEIVDPSGATLVTFAAFSFDSWSPDGRSILSHDLAIGDVGTGTVSRVSHGFGGRWSPDSRRLAFNVFEDGGVTTKVAGVQGGRPRRLARFGPVLGWSPDGRSILLGRSTGSGIGTGVFVVRADGSHLRRILRTPVASRLSGASWAAGGRRVVFRRETQGALYTIRPDGPGLRRLTGGGYGDSTPAWSPDGRSLAFARRPDPDTGEDLQVQRVVPAGARARMLLRCSGCRSPAWSPDGGRIAFAGLGYGIYTFRVGAADPVLLGSGSDPDWSPSGDRLAFTGRYGGVVVSGVGVVAEQGNDPAWSPDGRWIAYSGPGGIRTVHPDGTGDTLLVPGSGGSAAWSPDGRRLVFAEHGDLYLVRADGGGRRRLTSGAATDMTPDWQALPAR